MTSVENEYQRPSISSKDLTGVSSRSTRRTDTGNLPTGQQWNSGKELASTDDNAPTPSTAAGWHPDPYSPNANILRYYDGRQWTQHLAQQPVQAQTVVSTPVAVAPTPSAAAGWHPDPYSPNANILRYYDGRQWTQHLAQQPGQAQTFVSTPVAVSVAVGGGRGCNHLLHFILTVLTGGLWLPVWIICAILAGNKHTSAVSVAR